MSAESMSRKTIGSTKTSLQATKGLNDWKGMNQGLLDDLLIQGLLDDLLIQGLLDDLLIQELLDDLLII